MVKAKYALHFLFKNKFLPHLCKILDVDYKYIHLIINDFQNASANVQKALSPVIPPSYWYEEADDYFCENFKSEISPLFDDKSINIF